MGRAVGLGVGSVVGAGVGPGVGSGVGPGVGKGVGLRVSLGVGPGVGAGVGDIVSQMMPQMPRLSTQTTSFSLHSSGERVPSVHSVGNSGKHCGQISQQLSSVQTVVPAEQSTVPSKQPGG